MTTSSPIGNPTLSFTGDVTGSGSMFSSIAMTSKSKTFKTICLYATTASLSATYSNGSSGVGATLTGNSNGALNVDSSIPSVGDRILIKNQSGQLQNGVYTVTQVGDSTHPFILTRATDFDEPADVTIGTMVWVAITLSGVTNSGSLWMQTNDNVGAIGISPITFSGYKGQSTISGVGTITSGVWNAGNVTSSGYVSTGRAKGSVGASALEVYGADGSTSGPHAQFITSGDDYPLLQILNYSHNNVNISFDAYFDGGWKSSHSGSNFQISKNSNQLQVNYKSGVSPGAAVTWISGPYIDVTGNLTVPSPGVIYGARSGGMFSMEANATSTTITTANTFYKLAGTTTSQYLKDFTHSNNRLTYVGTQSITAKIDVTSTMQQNQVGGSIVTIAVFKNASRLTGSNSSANVANAVNLGINTTFAVTLSTNDYIEVWAAGSVTGQTVTANNLQCSITAI